MDPNSLGRQRNQNAYQILKHFRGCAIVKFRNLQLGSHFDKGNVSRLMKIFQIEGCANLDPENRITAVITSDVLNKVLMEGDVTESSLIDPANFPHLNLGQDTIKILQGQHRTRAASQLGIDEWLVDLFLDDLSYNLQNQLIEGFSNSRDYSDGEIYRSIRLSQLRNDELQELKWWSRLRSDGRRKDFRRLQRNQHFRRGFDLLLPFPGLWRPLKSSQIERMLSLRCPQIIFQYLSAIHQRWKTIFSEQNGHLLDAETVILLQGLCPHISLQDREEIKDLVHSKSVFPLVSAHRDEIARGLIEFPGRLISIATLVQDTLFLNGPARALHELCPPGSKGDFITILRRKWMSGDNHQLLRIQTSEHGFSAEYQTSISFEVAMMQLWLFALRHFVDNIHQTRQKKSFMVWTRTLSMKSLSKLAESSGFKSSQIAQIGTQSHKNFVRKIPQEFFHTLYEDQFTKVESDETPESYMSTTLNTYLYRQAPQFAEDQVVQYTTDDPSQNAKNRYNSPESSQYYFQRASMFIESLFQPTQTIRKYPTSLGITRDILKCFFGNHIEDWVGSRPNLNSRPVHSTPEPIQHDQSIQISTRSPPPVDDVAELQSQIDQEPQDLVLHSPIIENHRELHQQDQDTTTSQLLDRLPSPVQDSEMHDDMGLIAPGFEDIDNNGPLYKENSITHRETSNQILKQWFDAENKSLVVLYLFESRTYFKFPRHDKNEIRSRIRLLSSDYRFLVLDDEWGLTSPDFDKTLEKAMNQQLLFVQRKEHACNPNIVSNAISLEELKALMKVFDARTGKRKANVLRDDRDEDRGKRLQKYVEIERQGSYEEEEL